VISLDRYRIAVWTRRLDLPAGLDRPSGGGLVQGVDCTCPECDPDCRLLFSDIDGVSDMISAGVITG
jgi:hypothetical protein